MMVRKFRSSSNQMRIFSIFVSIILLIMPYYLREIFWVAIDMEKFEIFERIIDPCAWIGVRIGWTPSDYTKPIWKNTTVQYFSCATYITFIFISYNMKCSWLIHLLSLHRIRLRIYKVMITRMTTIVPIIAIFLISFLNNCSSFVCSSPFFGVYLTIQYRIKMMPTIKIIICAHILSPF